MNDRSDHHDGDHHDDVLAQLRAANPVVTDSTAHTQPAATALFEEIVMIDTLTRPIRPDRVVPTPAAPSRWRRQWVIPAAVAAAALAATATVAVWPSGGESAEAAVRTAAESTEAATSGTIEVSVDFSDDVEVVETRLVSSFFGDDVDALIAVTAEVDGSVMTEESRMRVVGDRFYVQGLLFEADDSTWYEADVATRDELFAFVGVPGAITSSGADGLVELLVGAGEVTRSGDDTYAAGITVGDARRLSEVPAGLSFLTAADSGLPDDQTLDLVVHVGGDGRLDSLSIDLAEQDSETNAAATIEVRYRDLDAGDPIEAPADAQPMPDVLNEAPTELEEPIAVVRAFFEANPDVCAGMVEPGELVACLRAEGHHQVADALASIETITQGS